MKIKHISEQHGVREIEGKRERERTRYKMSVAYLFIERAHIGTHGHMLACTLHRLRTRVYARARVSVLARVSLGNGRKVRAARFIFYPVYLLTREDRSRCLQK